MQLLKVLDLKVSFKTPDGTVDAVKDLSFSVNKGEILAIVGESGSGKSVTALSLLGLLEENAQTGGEIRYRNHDLLTAQARDMQAIRGNAISMVFQEPMSSLNPVLRIGLQVAECLHAHQTLSRSDAQARALALLKRVGIPAAEQRMREYPHQLSGGMRQRVMIAMALAGRPDLLIADEPTTALDVTVQAQILDLMRDLQSETGAAIILITHDLGIVAEMAQRVLVMYRGRKVEEGTTRDILKHARHPYTRALLRAVPRLGSSLTGPQRTRLAEAPLRLDAPANGSACAFFPRCPRGAPICVAEVPPAVLVDPEHAVACHFANEPMAAAPEASLARHVA